MIISIVTALGCLRRRGLIPEKVPGGEDVRSCAVHDVGADTLYRPFL